MGVESDRLVFDYLSRVGDLAQTALPAAQRAQLVARLRNDIDRERRGSDSPATVRRILGRIGSPDEVVEAAAGSAAPGGGTAAPPPPTEPPPGSYGPYAKTAPRTPRTPRQREEAGTSRGQEAGGRDGGQRDPGRRDAGGRDAGRRGARPRDDDPDWWTVPPRGGLPRLGDELAGLPGMTGGVFVPVDDEELAEEDPASGHGRTRTRRPDTDGEPYGAEETHEEEAPARRSRRLLPRLGIGKGGGGGGKRWGSPVLLLAAALLVAGAAIGSWIPLGLGWLTGYLSRQLSRPQAKFAVLGIPGTAAVGMLVWLWGRDAGKWSTPIAEGQMGQALQDALPGTVRLAALASALYLLWRARRAA
ncbi:hypothetical protein [Streptomyces sp.]|uniref:hypothetical protein n=1 Tax=Streptomyces sp. TaxID=1931 RepID=UPI002F4074BA